MSIFNSMSQITAYSFFLQSCTSVPSVTRPGGECSAAHDGWQRV